jgi:hypothetical protein
MDRASGSKNSPRTSVRRTDRVVAAPPRPAGTRPHPARAPRPEAMHDIEGVFHYLDPKRRARVIQ